MLITDYNVILTEAEKNYQDHDSFLIKDICAIVKPDKKKNDFIINVDRRPSYYFSCKKASEVIEMLKNLYHSCAKNNLVIYSVPYKELPKYETTQEDIANSVWKIPTSEFIEQDPLGKKDRTSSSTNDSDKEKEPVENQPAGDADTAKPPLVDAEEEDKSEVSDQKFHTEEKDPEINKKIIGQLGNDYLENQQRILNHGKSTLIFSKKTFMKSRKITQDNGFEECMKLLEANLGINADDEIAIEPRPKDEVIPEEEEDAMDSENDTISKSKSSSMSKSDSDVDPELGDFVILKMLNKGGFGKVFLVKNTLDGKYYAMKRIRKDLLIETGQIDNTMNEKTVLLKLQNPFLLGMSYAFQSEFRLYFFLDFVSGGDLYDNLVKVKKFEEAQAKFFIAQVLISLSHLHENKIVHRDLKPENVLVCPDGYVVLADFGLAKIFDEKTDMAHTMCGTPEYMAPEVLLGKSQTFTVDWWALGVLTYELATGRPPFKHKNDRKLRKLIKKGKFPWPDPEKHNIHLSEDLMDFIKMLLNPDPAARLGAKGAPEIMKHQWFKDINFEDIVSKKVKPTYIPEAQEVIEDNKVLIKSHRKFKKKVKKSDQQKDELLETCLGRARQKLIRDYQTKFEKF